jgi:hypothetical protein
VKVDFNTAKRRIDFTVTCGAQAGVPAMRSA